LQIFFFFLKPPIGYPMVNRAKLVSGEHYAASWTVFFVRCVTQDASVAALQIGTLRLHP
jgi:hypothetical protein